MPKRKKQGKKETAKLARIKKKNQVVQENRILRNFLIGIGVFVVFILVFVSIVNSSTKFTHEGVQYEVVREGELTFYNTQIPVVIDGRNIDYNFYLRNDPRKLYNEVAFEGRLLPLQNIVINSTSDFNCDGFGIIAVRNLATLYEVSGASVIKDTNATCHNDGQYTFVNLQEGDETKIRQAGLSCYKIDINNCEILEGTERLMIETFIRINSLR